MKKVVDKGLKAAIAAAGSAQAAGGRDRPFSQQAVQQWRRVPAETDPRRRAGDRRTAREA